MNTTRRKFLQTAGLVAGSATLQGLGMAHAEKILEEIALLKPEPSGGDDDFWDWIAQCYTSSQNMINLNNGGVSPQPKVVQEALQRYTEFCNETPAYTMWRILEPGRETVRARLARMLGCSPDEIAINRNTTEALDTVIRGIRLNKGDEVVLGKYDYPRMMNAWKYREKTEGIVLKWVDFDFPMETASEMVARYTEQFTPKTKFLHLTHMINWTGQLVPAREITAEAHKRGIPVLLDAAHTFAHIDFNIADINADYMGTSLHKWLCAPFGTGALFVKKDLIDALPTLFTEDPEKPPAAIRKFEELGTRNVPAELAIGQAITFHETIGTTRKQERLHYLKNYWCDALKDNDRITLRNSQNPEFSCGIGFMEIQGMKGSEIEHILREKYHINTVGISYEDIEGVRIAPHVYTRTQDLDMFVDAVKSIIKKI